jgi:glycosyltransferase involved in cell wall biosynthesis
MIVSIAAIVVFVIEAIRHARRADVICSHWMVPSGLAGALASTILGKPHVVIEHSGALHLLARTPGGRTIARFIVKHSREVITVSSRLRRKLIALVPDADKKTCVIPMGVRIDEAPKKPGLQSGRAKKTSTALFLGRLTEIKGVELLLRALLGMDDVKLIVAGEGKMRAALERQAQGLSIKPSFLGQVGAEKRAALLAGCDFVVIPSVVLPCGRTEGTPVVCLESLAAGRPVIASRSGGLADVIVDGYNGLLFEPGDCIELAATIRRLIDDPALKERLATNARLTAREYDWEAISRNYSRSIMSALDKNDQRIGD